MISGHFIRTRKDIYGWEQIPVDYLCAMRTAPYLKRMIFPIFCLITGYMLLQKIIRAISGSQVIVVFRG